MALPGGFLEELRLRTPLAPLIGRRTRLERAGRQFRACCPFHNEKTPSLHIWDDHYHCFGCGAHGDAISFVMQSEGASFMEAVERLAGEAGLEVPRLAPALAEAERRRHTLAGALEMAAVSFQRRLFLPEGRRALDYLLGRGLTQDTIRRFGLGWSGESRGTLTAELAREGIGTDLLIEAGLMRADPDTGRSYELFFNRVMFPIRDRRGTVISFGGRTLGDGQPKYLNGPETTLFAKRRSLYGLDLARETQGKAELVVVEGYMDVIALHQAGFGAAVAPLGTALTEDQLRELWRLSPAPILCFDGDRAGAAATERAILMALPHLTSSTSLRTVWLPDQSDPDSFVRTRGSQEFATLISQPIGLTHAIYRLFRRTAFVQDPEGRAIFVSKLEKVADLVKDPNLRWEYRKAFREACRGEFKRLERQVSRAGLAQTEDPDLVSRTSDNERGRILTAILLRHPGLLHDVEHAFAGVALPPACERLRKALLGWADHADVLDSQGLIDHLTASGLAADAAQVLAAVPVPLPIFASAEAMPGDAETGWWHIFGLTNRARLEEEVAVARRAFADCADEQAQRRLIALCAARDALVHAEPAEPGTPGPDRRM